MAKNEDIKKAIGKRIATLRRARGWSQEQLAVAAGISMYVMGRMERGASITLDNLVAVGRGLDTALDALVEVDEDLRLDPKPKVRAIATMLHDAPEGVVDLVHELVGRLIRLTTGDSS